MLEMLSMKKSTFFQNQVKNIVGKTCKIFGYIFEILLLYDFAQYHRIILKILKQLV